MHQQDCSTETVPLQGVNFGRQPGQTGVVQHTTVNIGQPVPETPQDHIIWSLCCFVYSNPFCLGVLALIYSIKARDRKVAGDLEGARRHGSTARNFNIAATVIAAAGLLIFVITFSVIMSSLASSRYYVRGSGSFHYN
uniref:Uncharacterized protein n=1 Tax=Oreochromis aureus TaxID=47969 RepID=A0AAZ1Y408_OREAU